MPILMNKGTNPYRAAWLYWSSADELRALAAAIGADRLDTGAIAFDADELEAAAKPTTPVTVYLRATKLVPADFDLDELDREVELIAGRMRRDAEMETTGEEGTGDTEAQTADGATEMTWEAVDAPEGMRYVIGTTVAHVARELLQPRAIKDEEWTGELPNLQMLRQFVGQLDGAGMPNFSVWHVDSSGIMRMAPAKQVKVMAANTLNVKR